MCQMMVTRRIEAKWYFSSFPPSISDLPFSFPSLNQPWRAVGSVRRRDATRRHILNTRTKMIIHKNRKLIFAYHDMYRGMLLSSLRVGIRYYILRRRLGDADMLRRPKDMQPGRRIKKSIIPSAATRDKFIYYFALLGWLMRLMVGYAGGYVASSSVLQDAHYRRQDMLKVICWDGLLHVNCTKEILTKCLLKCLKDY